MSPKSARRLVAVVVCHAVTAALLEFRTLWRTTDTDHRTGRAQPVVIEPHTR